MSNPDIRFFMVILGFLTSIDPHINPILFVEDITVKPGFLTTAMIQSLKHISASISLAVYMRKKLSNIYGNIR